MPNTTTASPQTAQVDAQSYRVGLDRKVSFPPIGEEVTRTLQGGAHPLGEDMHGTSRGSITCCRPCLGR